MKLNCKHVWNALSEYLDGGVDPVLREQIEQHLIGLGIPEPAEMLVFDQI